MFEHFLNNKVEKKVSSRLSPLQKKTEKEDILVQGLRTRLQNNFQVSPSFSDPKETKREYFRRATFIKGRPIMRRIV